MRIADSEPWWIECVVSRGRIKVDTVAQAQAMAIGEWGSMGNHFVQVYGTLHVASEYPQLCCPSLRPATGGNAFWVPAQKELFATNGTDTQGGSYVTATVKGASHRASILALATAVTRAALNVAPREPNPGSPQ
ncbi:MAG: hypothetical protein JO321_07145 [Solirubrobacterales bacterium]|nr:hypothetical protein [Solirubrobacterales bacterium]